MVILFNKPYGVLSQFTPASTGKQSITTLAAFIDQPAVYPAGRLDKDSEGLLVLTDDGQLQQTISQSHNQSRSSEAWSKTYWVQVEGQPDADSLQQLREGILLKDGPTRPAKVKSMVEPAIWPRQPPVRQRRQIPTCWLSLTLTEGRNRQVRRMTAAIGHPTLRLIRYRIGSWTIDGLNPGQYFILTSTKDLS